MSRLKEELLSEIEEFRTKGQMFLDGEISMMEFKHESGGFGVYAERNKKTFVIRIRVPSGITHIDEMKWVCDEAEKFGLEKVHLTTREAIQFHNISLEAVCEIMKDGLERNIFTRGAGGNYPRNVAMSPFAGVDKFEAFDVTPYALAANNYFLKRITTYNLPRKLKVAFSSSNMDLGHCNITDLGFLAVMKNGKKYFKVYIGGGLGQNPRKAVALDELAEPKEVLYYIEAMVKLFMAEGDYKNRAKARIRYILDRMGEEEFKQCFNKHLNEVKDSEDLIIELSPKEYTKEPKKANFKHTRMFEQKQEGLYCVYFHPIGGQLNIKDCRDILNVIDKMDDIELRLTMTEGLLIRNLNGDEAAEVLKVTDGRGGETHIEQSVSCIGVPTCQIGLLESQKTLRDIIDYFRDKKYDKDVLPRVQISGCGNSCGIHQACLIGFTGKKKRVDGEMKDAFELHINGSFEEGNSRLGKVYGTILACEIPEYLYELSLSVEKYGVHFSEYLIQHEDEFEELTKKYTDK